MDDLAKYRVILSGSVVPGYDRANVLTNLAEVFNSNTEMMDRLLQGEAVPLRKVYEKDKAKLICKKVRSAGAHCILQKIPETELTLSDDDLTGKLDQKKCPACQNLLQEGWTKCPGCGYFLKGASSSGVHGVSVAGTDRSASGESIHREPSRETKLQELINRFVSANTEYYQSQFKKFGNPRKPVFKVSWNWPAFFFFFFWALYRKMWIWAGVHMLGGIGMMFLISPGPVYLIWALIWPVSANYLYFRIAASTAILAREAPDFEEKFLDKGGVSKVAVWGGVLVAMFASIMISNYVTSKFLAEYGDQLIDVLPGSGSQTRGDGSLLEDVSSSSSELAKTSRKLSGLATSIKILLVTDKSKTNQEAISAFINQLIAGEVLDGWGSAIRVEQHTDQYILLSAGPDQKFKTDDDVLQTIKIP
jgi:hypothetical protein